MKKQTHGFRSLFKKGVTTLLACSLLGSIISTGMLSALAATTEDIVVKHNSADYLVETTGSDRYGNGDWWCLNNSDYSIYKVTLNRYIEDSLEELNEKAAAMPRQEEADPESLDNWFRRVII